MAAKELGTEYPGKNEEKHTDTIVRMLSESINDAYNSGEEKKRFHVSGIGIIRAKFIVDADIPDHLKVGLFQTPATYDAIVRFSNGPHKATTDDKKCARGMAIKILNTGVAPIVADIKYGNSQDFMLTTSKVLFPGRVALYMWSIRALFKNKLIMLFIIPNPFNWRGIASIIKGKKRVTNVLEEEYYSSTPYLFGEKKAIKWMVKPTKQNTSVAPNNPAPDFLAQRLIADVKSSDFDFNFGIQEQLNVDAEPIENSAIEWRSPFVKLATLHIFQQTPDPAEQIVMSERITYSPWHASPEHRPLGGNNRVRRKVYEVLSKMRKTE